MCRQGRYRGVCVSTIIWMSAATVTSSASRSTGRTNVLNAVSPDLHADLAEVFRDASDTDARVIILTGNGRAFCAGGDVESMQDWDAADFEDMLVEGERIVRDLVNVRQPVIARLNGDAIGLGATLALFCDIVVAAEDANIGDPHVKVGLTAGDGGAVIWPLLTSMSKAKELLMTGEAVSATEAEELGLVNHAVPAEELDETVEELVDKLASGPQPAIRYTKAALNGWLELAMTTSLGKSLALEGLSQQREDHRAAVDAFVEGQEPDYPTSRNKDRDTDD